MEACLRAADGRCLAVLCLRCWPSMECRFASVLTGLAGTLWSVLLASYVSPHPLTRACGQAYELASAGGVEG